MNLMDMTTELMVEKGIDLLHENNLSCILTSVSDAGYPLATVIKPICGLSLETIYFILDKKAELVKNYNLNSKGGISYYSGKNSVQLTGDVSVISAEKLCEDVTDTHLFSTCVPNGCVLLKFATDESHIHIGEENYVLKT